MTPRSRSSFAVALHSALSLLVVLNSAAADDDAESPAKQPPAVGDTALDFELQSLDGKKTSLKGLTEKGPVVLVVLRGYPGYQCPICNFQVSRLLNSAAEFEQAAAQVAMVYPGEVDQLDERAKEFVGQRSLPDHFHFLVDAGYNFTNKYALRWNAPRETAYPSTFIIDRRNKVRYAKISKSHGGRASAQEVLDALAKLSEE